jgi:hypothetical protein
MSRSWINAFSLLGMTSVTAITLGAVSADFVAACGGAAAGCCALQEDPANAHIQRTINAPYPNRRSRMCVLLISDFI